MTEYYRRCHRCHKEGHWRQDCPEPEPLPPPAQPSGPPTIPPRVHPDPAIARQWAAAIRERLGWTDKENP